MGPKWLHFVEKGAGYIERFIVETLLDEAAANRSGRNNCDNHVKKGHIIVPFYLEKLKLKINE